MCLQQYLVDSASDSSTSCVVSLPVPRLTRLALAWLAFSAPLGYCIFHNTTATLYYISDCLAALLDVFWFFPWLRGVVEYLLLIPYRMLCFFTGGGYTEEAWKKVLEILLREYSQQEREALTVSANCVTVHGHNCKNHPKHKSSFLSCGYFVCVLFSLSSYNYIFFLFLLSVVTKLKSGNLVKFIRVKEGFHFSLSYPQLTHCPRWYCDTVPLP